MKIALGTDHRGVALKEYIKRLLSKRGIRPQDVGTNDDEPVDYPDFAQRVGRLVAAGKADQGILLCGSGLGMSMAANKMPRIRAALCLTPKMAMMARTHNDANVLVLAADLTTRKQVAAILKVWLGSRFSGAGRHERRIRKMDRM